MLEIVQRREEACKGGAEGRVFFLRANLGYGVWESELKESSLEEHRRAMDPSMVIFNDSNPSIHFVPCHAIRPPSENAT